MGKESRRNRTRQRLPPPQPHSRAFLLFKTAMEWVKAADPLWKLILSIVTIAAALIALFSKMAGNP